MKLVLLFIAGAALAAAQKIAGGPLVVNATPRTATVVWLVEGSHVTLQAAGAPQRTSPSLRVEKTTLTGLQPNTRYEYDVAGQAAGKGSFKTPPIGAGAYRFVVYGDTRTRHDVHRKVVNALVAHGIPDFVLHTGDLVADGNDTSMWPVFFDIEKDLVEVRAGPTTYGVILLGKIRRRQPYQTCDDGAFKSARRSTRRVSKCSSRRQMARCDDGPGRSE